MGKIQRVTGKIFGETASAIDDPILGPEIGQFGSAKAGTYFGTTDIATIQDLPAWSNGWIDAVTPTDQFPPLPERTGVDKNFSQQICYLLQQGVPEWDAATDYHTNGYCSYDGYIYKSLADNNINHTPDEEGSIYWEKYGANGDFANRDLSNLTNLGNSRLQYAPFSINNGRITNAGANATVTTLSGTEVAWTQPTMTANGVLGGSSFAVEASSVYNTTYDAFKAFDDNATTQWLSDIPTNVTFPVNLIIYNPDPIKVTSIAITNRLTYLGSFTEGSVYGSNDNSTWTQVVTFTNDVTAASSQWSIDLSTNTNFYNYYKLEFTNGVSGSSTYSYGLTQVTLTATQQVSNGLSCYPCTITTCDGRTKVFDTASSLDTSTMTDGDYLILKNYNDGTLSLIKQGLLKISKSFKLHGTTAGSITVDRNGVCGGFSTSNYIYTPTVTLTGGATWKLTFEVTTGNNVSTGQYFVGGYGLSSAYDPITIAVASGKWNVSLSNSTSSYIGSITGTSDVQTDTTYEGYIEFTGTAYNLYINGELEGTLSSTASIYAAKWVFGAQSTTGGALSAPWLGTINMNKVGLIRSGQNYWTGKEGYLDNSVFPYQLYLLQDDWTKPLVNNNDLVCIASCTLTSGVPSSVYNFVFDATKPGEWVNKSTSMSTATAIGTRTISLTDYLPKDIFNYEIMFSYFISRQDSSNLDTYYYLSSDGFTYLRTHVDGGNSNSDNQTTGGQCVLLEHGTRAFSEQVTGTDNKALTGNSLYTIAYRRVGT